MISVKILNAGGTSVKRDELATLFATDLNYEPYRRQTTVDADGTIHLTVPAYPVILHAKLLIPGYGFMWIVADNCGRGYNDNAEVDFIYEAAISRIYAVEQVLSNHDFHPSPACLGKLSDAKTLMELSERNPNKKAEYNITALSVSMLAGEMAVVERAREKIRSCGKRDFLFGCGAFTYPFEGEEPEKKKWFDSLFNYTTLPFYLQRLEPEKGKPDYSTLDRLLDEFEKSGIQTKAHPLWWAHEFHGMPKWTEELKWEDGSIAREINRVVPRSVKRYLGRIHYFDVINEAHDWCNRYNLTQKQEAEMTKLCCDAVHSVDPSAKAVINTCFMFGENVADGRVQWGPSYERNMTPFTYLQKVEELGTQYDVIGMQLYCPSRDMLAIDQLYDRYSVFHKPIHMTELGVPSQFEDVPPYTTEGDLYCLRYMYSGLWREMEWNERLQADWMEWFYTVSYAREEIEALTWWSFDPPAYVPAAEIYRDQKPKEACFRLKALEEEWGFHFGK
jgi:endo-1,4-beta-xylanase